LLTYHKEYHTICWQRRVAWWEG